MSDPKAEKAAAAAAEREARKLARQAKQAAKKGGAAPPTIGDPSLPSGIVTDLATAKVAKVDTSAEPTFSCVRVSEKNSSNIKLDQISLSLAGNVLLESSTLEINKGARYGLIGRSGCGKSTLLKCLADRSLYPKHMDTYILDGEAPPVDMPAVDYVIEGARKELERLEQLSEQLLTEEGPESEALQDVYDALSALDPSTFVSRASAILIGLGFTTATLYKKCCDCSGGWRMRIALARAIFIAPSVLLLDEPTNHLDLNAVMWLGENLSKYPHSLVLISHSQDFLNEVTTDTIVMEQKKLKHWGGNYDQYVQTRAEVEKNQMTLYKKQQEEIAHIKAFIASCGTYANMVRQAESRRKVLDKMMENPILEPYRDPVFRFKFPETSKMPPPLISFSDVAFSYSGKKEEYLFSGLNFGIDSDSRITLVGPNGAGKSTLLKLMVGENVPCEGTVSVRAGVSIGRYHQHSSEVLDAEATPVEYISRKYQDRYPTKQLQEWRSVVGSFGIPSNYHLLPIKCLSEGLKSRLVLCEISLQNPHILLFDEPTNAADMEMIDSLAEAINAYDGGVVVISHDFRLLEKIGGQVWIVDKGIKEWTEGIPAYKKTLSASM